MPYYQGDYYAGDFYTGDPFWGGLFRGAVRGIRAITGLGKAPRAVMAAPAAAGVASTAIMRLPGAGQVVRVGGQIVQRTAAVIAKHPVLTAAGAAGTIGVLGGRVTAPGAARAVPGMQRGFHISKRTGAVVRNRRMRVTNPRALRRAIRRATGFARLARRVLHFTSPRAPRGRAIFKRRRKK